MPAADDNVKVTVRRTEAVLEAYDAGASDSIQAAVTVRAPQVKVTGARTSEDKGKELLKAARDGDVRKIKALVDDGAPLDAVDDKGFTAMHLCAATGLAPGVVVLAKAGAEINSVVQKYTPLLMAIGYNKPFTTEVLLKCGADTSIEDAEGNSAIEFVEGLIAQERQADADGANEEGGNFITKTFTKKVNKRLDALLEMQETLKQVPAAGRVPPEETVRNIEDMFDEIGQLVDLDKPLNV